MKKCFPQFISLKLCTETVRYITHTSVVMFCPYLCSKVVKILREQRGKSLLY